MLAPLKQLILGTKEFLHFARDYKIAISPHTILKGILCALAGWFLVAVATVYFRIPWEIVPLGINLFIQFSSGALAIVIASIFKGFIKNRSFNGYKNLLISSKNEILGVSHLTVQQRIRLIYVRGFIATGGYALYELAKTSIGSVDNSIIHGADALMYALLAFILLKQRFSKRELKGIVIAFIGILIILYFDVMSRYRTQALWGYGFGIGSSVALAVIIILTSVIIQHDQPLRVAFHQCICGILISLPILIYSLIVQRHLEFSLVNIQNAAIGGVAYAFALVFFFHAFLYVEPIIIAISSYSLEIYLIIFQLINVGFIPIHDIVGGMVISLGTGILVYEEYRKEKSHE